MVVWIINYSLDGMETWHHRNFTTIEEAQSFTAGLIIGSNGSSEFDYYIQRAVEASRNDFMTADSANDVRLLLYTGLMASPKEVRELQDKGEQ